MSNLFLLKNFHSVHREQSCANFDILQCLRSIQDTQPHQGATETPTKEALHSSIIQSQGFVLPSSNKVLLEEQHCEGAETSRQEAKLPSHPVPSSPIPDPYKSSMSKQLAKETAIKTTPADLSDSTKVMHREHQLVKVAPIQEPHSSSVQNLTPDQQNSNKVIMSIRKHIRLDMDFFPDNTLDGKRSVVNRRLNVFYDYSFSSRFKNLANICFDNIFLAN